MVLVLLKADLNEFYNPDCSCNNFCCHSSSLKPVNTTEPAIISGPFDQHAVGSQQLQLLFATHLRKLVFQLQGFVFQSAGVEKKLFNGRSLILSHCCSSATEGGLSTIWRALN